MTTVSTLTALLRDLACVEQAKPWNDRVYVTLAGVSRHHNADLRTKIWARGDVLTIEEGKGYHSDAWIASKYALLDAVRAAGCTVREI